MPQGSLISNSGFALLEGMRQPFRTFWSRSDRAPLTEAPPPPARAGHGEPVLVFPMFGAGPESTARLRAALDREGFATFDWGYGIDTGPRAGNMRNRLRRLEELVIDLYESERQPLTLIGWGLSGIYARELAKRASPLVRQVITLGTPISPGPGECPMLQSLEEAPGRLSPELAAQLKVRPPVPCTSIYSMSDQAVPWQMCVIPESIISENVLVPAHRHRELADHPMAREVIVDRLAQPQDEWRPYARA
jgi:pimeloyl-ACP methyl ester carboxylesterase